jgi:hypothetical protein
MRIWVAYVVGGASLIALLIGWLISVLRAVGRVIMWPLERLMDGILMTIANLHWVALGFMVVMFLRHLHWVG